MHLIDDTSNEAALLTFYDETDHQYEDRASEAAWAYARRSLYLLLEAGPDAQRLRRLFSEDLAHLAGQLVDCITAELTSIAQNVMTQLYWLHELPSLREQLERLTAAGLMTREEHPAGISWLAELMWRGAERVHTDPNHPSRTHPLQWAETTLLMTTVILLGLPDPEASLTEFIDTYAP